MKSWLEEKRLDKGFSQQELADRVNISREYISMIENGQRTPSVTIAKKISKELGVPWVKFF